MNLPKIRLFREEDRKQLEENANKQNHGVFNPLYVVEGENGELIGYFSVMPMVVTWMDKEKMGGLASTQVLSFACGTLATNPLVCFPCDLESPYHPYMEKFGMVKFAKCDLFIKVNQ